MEIRQLQAFIVVAEELHFGRAAARLHIAQPPLSQLIRALERDLGTELFARTTRSVRLTPAGAALLGPARIIIDQLAVARAVTRAAALGETGVVRLGFGGPTGYVVLSALIQAVAERYPGIKLELRPQTYSGQVVHLLEEGTLDMGVVALPVPGDLTTATLRHEHLMVALPTRHRLAEQQTVAAEDLANEPFVTYPPDHGSAVRDATVALCAAAGFTPRIAQEAPDPYSLLALVGTGLGIAIVVASTTHFTVDGVTYRPISDAPSRLHTGLAWRADNTSPALHRVVEILPHVIVDPTQAPEAP